MESRPILRRLGPDAPTVGAIGYGGMALSFEQRPPESEAIRLMHTVLDQGVTFIDTADIYAPDERDIGHNERLIAKALRSWNGPRDRITVASKGGYTKQHGRLVPDGRPTHLRQACERSLRALGVDVIDLYQLHTRDPAVPLQESVGALRELHDQGKVRWIGLSNVTVTEIELARTIAPVQSVQNPLSLLHQDSAKVGPIARLERRGVFALRQLRRLAAEPFKSGVLAHCERLGLGFVASSPLGGHQMQRLATRPALQRIARERDSSVQAVAIAWVLAQSRAVIPIPSARTIAHATDTLKGASLKLTEQELAAIARGG
jgi:aryl-alcohol dehydrogenase-like predicted oxidoreductase